MCYSQDLPWAPAHSGWWVSHRLIPALGRTRKLRKAIHWEEGKGTLWWTVLYIDEPRQERSQWFGPQSMMFGRPGWEGSSGWKQDFKQNLSTILNLRSNRWVCHKSWCSIDWLVTLEMFIEILYFSSFTHLGKHQIWGDMEGSQIGVPASAIFYFYFYFYFYSFEQTLDREIGCQPLPSFSLIPTISCPR